MTTQLRVYTINKGKLDEFVKVWRDGVYPLRQKFGFKIERAWTIPERNEFIWTMSYDGLGDWETQDKAYYASPERAARLRADRSMSTPDAIQLATSLYAKAVFFLTNDARLPSMRNLRLLTLDNLKEEIRR